MNFCAFRLPGQSGIRLFGSETLVEIRNLPERESFLLAPFDIDEGVFAIPADIHLTSFPNEDIRTNMSGKTAPVSTSENEYCDYVSRIVSFLQGREGEKIVASRRLTLDIENDLKTVFHSLCGAYPDAYVYFISTSRFGNWLGASPELLLQREGNILSTMALAGTRSAGTDTPWDKKNMEEQRIVTDYILSVFKSFGLPASASYPTTVNAGAIEHIMTAIRGKMTDSAEILDLIKTLSPTPALSGYPKRSAMDFIRMAEADHRGLYGGFSGYLRDTGDFSLYVTLRCLSQSPGKVTLFAGGGVTSLSLPQEEWTETERKLRTLLPYLSPRPD